MATVSDPVPVTEIPKTEEDIAVIKAKDLSASVLQSYITCPAKFYYSAVKQLRQLEDVNESLDQGMFGNVYHHTMQGLYDEIGPVIDRAALKALAANKPRIKEEVRKQIIKETNNIEVVGRDLIMEDVLCYYVRRTIERDREMLEAENMPSFKILGHEFKRFFKLHGFRFKGYIDRLDSFGPGQLRVVDYKTGKVVDKDVNISDDNALDVVEEVFEPDDRMYNWPKIALQMYLYDEMLDQAMPGNRLINSVYDVKKIALAPVLNVPRSKVFCEEMRARLGDVLEEMVDPEIPFHLTPYTERCEYCDFKKICGR